MVRGEHSAEVRAASSQHRFEITKEGIHFKRQGRRRHEPNSVG